MIDKDTILENCKNTKCDLEELCALIANELDSARGSAPESELNKLWALHEVVTIHKLFLDTYKLLKEGNYYAAWCKAEKVEISCLILENNDTELYKSVEKLASVVASLQSIYPYKIFASHVARISKEECSICHKTREINNPCGHRVGKVYNGEVCYNIVKDFKFMGVDLVRNPVNKSCVVFLVDEDNPGKDLYNYSAVAYLMKHWHSPYQYWMCQIEYNHIPATKYPNLNDGDMCPCRSGKKFAECCKHDELGIKQKNYHFNFT